MMKNYGRTDKRGSTLLSVIVVTAILSLFLLTLQPIMFRYAQRSLDERDMKQAELSARGANDAIITAIMDGNAQLIAGIKGITTDGSSLQLTEFTFSSVQMGSVEARIERVSANKFKVITKAVVNNESRTISREISKTDASGGGGSAEDLGYLQFYRLNFRNGGGFTTNDNIPVVISNSFDLNGGSLNIAGDLVLLPTTRNIRGNSILNIDGNLYTSNGTQTISGSAMLTIKGELYTSTNSPITRAVAPSNIRYCPDIYTVTTTMRNDYSAVPSWVRSTGTNYVNGMTFNGGTYYVMTGTRTISNITSQFNSNVTSNNPVYIIIRNNGSLTLSNPIDPPVGGSPQSPRIVFILEGNADVHIRNGTSAIVYGTVNTELYVDDPSYGASVIYGQYEAGILYHNSDNQVLIEYTTRNPEIPETWTAGLYIKDSY